MSNSILRGGESVNKHILMLVVYCLAAIVVAGYRLPSDHRQTELDYFPTNLLPDLRTLPPGDLRLVVDREAGRKYLRFSNAIWNSGPGPLELRGEMRHDEESARVIQVIYREDGSLDQRPAGQFYLHAEHNHVHWEAFSLYQLWTAHPDGRLERLVASREKVGYCIRDYAPHPQQAQFSSSNLREDQTPRPTYTSCSWLRQGLSVGWSDVYKSNTPGQFMEISHLPDGLYALKSSADPQNMLHEARESNNSAQVFLVLRQERIRVYQPGELFTHLRPAVGQLARRFTPVRWGRDWD